MIFFILKSLFILFLLVTALIAGLALVFCLRNPIYKIQDPISRKFLGYPDSEQGESLEARHLCSFNLSMEDLYKWFKLEPNEADKKNNLWKFHFFINFHGHIAGQIIFYKIDLKNGTAMFGQDTFVLKGSNLISNLFCFLNQLYLSAKNEEKIKSLVSEKLASLLEFVAKIESTSQIIHIPIVRNYNNRIKELFKKKKEGDINAEESKELRIAISIRNQCTYSEEDAHLYQENKEKFESTQLQNEVLTKSIFEQGVFFKEEIELPATPFGSLFQSKKGVLFSNQVFEEIRSANGLEP